jgi:CRP-like cAMP-binding protein
MFGETCLVEGGPREEMAEAMENTMVTELERGEVEQLLQAHAQLGYQLTRLLARRRLDLENKLETLVFRDVTSKLAELLLKLGEEYGVEDSRGTLIALKITHQELANLIGSTRETVSLTLSQFKKKSLICTDGRKVIISDAESLRALF